MLLGSAEQPAEVPAMAQPAQSAQSATDLAPLDPAALIGNAIDQITAQLAAFCFEQLERGVILGDVLDSNTDVAALEDEFQVRHYIMGRPNLYIQLTAQIILSDLR